MILSDQDIKWELRSGRLEIDPLRSSNDIQPASVDVHLGNKFQVLIPADHQYAYELDTHKDNQWAFLETEANDDGSMWIPPHTLVLAQVEELVTLPNDIACQVGGKSSIGRLGLQVHATAGFVDPGWSGHLTLELTNLTGLPIVIHVGDRIAQLIFMRLSSPATRMYQGKYQNATETQASRSHLDYEHVIQSTPE